MSDFRLHWWRAPNGRSNLGDEISPIIFGHVSGRSVIYAEISDCDGIAVGSVFNPRQASRRKRSHPQVIWGSGTLKPRPAIYDNLLAEIVALRGPRTAGQIAGCPDIAFGDPGLFVPEIWPSDGSPEVPIGIIPHFSMLGSEKVKRLSSQLEDSITVDLTDQDFARTFRQIASCELVISSSLHGLIFADAYGIPSLFWNEMGPENEWKYQDYFEGVGRPDYCSMNVTDISDVLRSGTVRDLPFSLLPEARMRETVEELRSALQRSSVMADHTSLLPASSPLSVPSGQQAGM